MIYSIQDTIKYKNLSYYLHLIPALERQGDDEICTFLWPDPGLPEQYFYNRRLDLYHLPFNVSGQHLETWLRKNEEIIKKISSLYSGCKWSYSRRGCVGSWSNDLPQIKNEFIKSLEKFLLSN